MSTKFNTNKLKIKRTLQMYLYLYVRELMGGNRI